jgi:hypothetical protein
MTRCTCILARRPGGRWFILVADPDCPGARVHARTAVLGRGA